MSALLWIGIILFILWPLSLVFGTIFCINTIVDDILKGSKKSLGICGIFLGYNVIGWIFSIVGFIIIVIKIITGIFGGIGKIFSSNKSTSVAAVAPVTAVAAVAAQVRNNNQRPLTNNNLRGGSKKR
jgi:hypothetical protein